MISFIVFVILDSLERFKSQLSDFGVEVRRARLRSDICDQR